MNTKTVGPAFYKSLAAIALPVALQNLISFSVNLMDTIMLGSLGEVALSASSLANQVFFIYTVAVFGIASGATVLCSQYWGKKDVEAIRRVTALSLRLAAAVGVGTTVVLLLFPRQVMQIFTGEADVIAAGVDYLRIVCFSYLFYGVTATFLMVLRSTETVRISVVIYAVSFVVNVGGNYAFIFGRFGAPRMGVAGAAVGTVLARVAEFILVLGYMAFWEKKLRFKPQMIALPSQGLGRDLWHYGLPVMLNELLWSLAISMHSVVLGHMGSDAVAANSICYIMYEMVTSVILGVANGSAVLVGKIIGEGDWAYARACVSRLVRVYAVLGVVCAVLVFVVGLPMLALYDIQPGTVALAKQLLGVYAFAMFFQAFTCPLISGVLRGGGDTRFAMAVDAGCIWAMVPLGAAAAFLLGAPAAVVLFVLKFDMPVKAVLCLRRLAGGQWMRSVTR